MLMSVWEVRMSTLPRHDSRGRSEHQNRVLISQNQVWGWMRMGPGDILKDRAEDVSQ